jgi:transmembrane sensor
MTQGKTMAYKAHSREAAEWVARLGGEPAEADWLAFEQWLNAADGRRTAYDRALALSLSIDRHGAALSDLLDRASAPRAKPAAAAWGAGLMTMAAAAVTFAALHPKPQPQVLTYATAKGERRDLVLADGTRVALNAGSTLSAAIGRDRRELTLVSGEAAFRVAHDPGRPFLVHVGDRVLRDVGTEFDVLRQNGEVTVTVREGMVSVQRSADDPRSLSLGPGSRLEHVEGSAKFEVLAADADEAFAWRAGRLIYRSRALSDVAADLNRYGEEEVRVAGPAAALRFTGVLTIDNQKAMIQRLTSLMPIAASPRNDGVILLSALNSAR